jgi:hypothetical protein
MPGTSPGMTNDMTQVETHAIIFALGCSTGRYPADNARNVEGGVSSIAFVIVLGVWR